MAQFSRENILFISDQTIALLMSKWIIVQQNDISNIYKLQCVMTSINKSSM